MKNAKKCLLFAFAVLTGCTSSEYIEQHHDLGDVNTGQKGDSVYVVADVDDEADTFLFHLNIVPHVFIASPYPAGPYAIDKFQVMPNMEFYNPWSDQWTELEDFYLSEDVKALLIVSSAGWCGPCLKEAAALIGIYDKYNADGLEIIYTLGNTNIPGDVPFDGVYDSPNSAGFAADLYFMNSWVHMTETEAGQPINYKMYADVKSWCA